MKMTKRGLITLSAILLFFTGIAILHRYTLESTLLYFLDILEEILTKSLDIL